MPGQIYSFFKKEISKKKYTTIKNIVMSVYLTHSAVILAHFITHAPITPNKGFNSQDLAMLAFFAIQAFIYVYLSCNLNMTEIKEE